jgi:hypothetical protein
LNLLLEELDLGAQGLDHGLQEDDVLVCVRPHPWSQDSPAGQDMHFNLVGEDRRERVRRTVRPTDAYREGLHPVLGKLLIGL